MNAEDRLNRALAARVAPAKDMHFTLQVMRQAEASRYRAARARRMLQGAALAGLVAVAALSLTDWAAASPEMALDAALAVGGLAALGSMVRLMGRRAPVRSR